MVSTMVPTSTGRRTRPIGVAGQAAAWGSMEVRPHPLPAPAWHLAPPARIMIAKAAFSARPEHVKSPEE
jgi:hypothetical protein